MTNVKKFFVFGADALLALAVSSRWLARDASAPIDASQFPTANADEKFSYVSAWGAPDAPVALLVSVWRRTP